MTQIRRILPPHELNARRRRIAALKRLPALTAPPALKATGFSPSMERTVCRGVSSPEGMENLPGQRPRDA